MKPEQITALISKLIAERLKSCLLQTSKSLEEKSGQVPLRGQFEKNIVQIKSQHGGRIDNVNTLDLSRCFR